MLNKVGQTLWDKYFMILFYSEAKRMISYKCKVEVRRQERKAWERGDVTDLLYMISKVNNDVLKLSKLLKE